jgi:hypothetical protein
VDSHLVSVEVRVEGRTYEWVKLDSVAFDKTRTERLDTLTVKRWCAVKQHVLAGNSFFENFPYFRYAVFNQAACTTNVEGEFARKKSSNNEWAEELKCHVLWKTTLIELEIRTHHNYGTT